MSATIFDPGGCGCTTTCASPTITGNVKGCGSRNAPGVTVEAHDSTATGTLIGSTTTDASGNYSLSGLSPVTSGNNIVVVIPTGGRFATASRTLAWSATTADSSHWKCGATSTGVNFTLTAASGYVCVPNCALPISKTLHATDSLAGSATLTWVSGTQWQGTISSTYGTCAGGCPGGSCTLGMSLDLGPSPALGVGWYTDVSGTCPGNTYPYTVYVYSSTSAGAVLNCPESGAFSFGGTIASNTIFPMGTGTTAEWIWHGCVSEAISTTATVTE